MFGNAKVVSIFADKLGIRQWSFVGPSSEKKWFSVVENSPQRICDIIEETILVEFADNGCPIFRVTTPLSRCNLKSKRHGKLSIHFAADQETIETVFRKMVSANQLNLYGTVAKTCEECESLHDRSGKPDMVMGQSIVLSEIKTEVPSENDDPAWETLHCNNMRNELRGFHNKIDWVHVVCMQDSWVLLKLDSIHDERHWWTILCSGLSWIHSSKRWWIITTERMDSWKHTHWTRAGSHD